MNLVLFEPGEPDSFLPAGDRRETHIRNVLKLSPGDSFEAGVVNGPSGRATIVSMTETGIGIAQDFSTEPGKLYPVTLVIGFPRPIQARRILKDLTTLGVETIRFVGTDTGEKSYRDSTLWKGEYRQYMYEGAEQAGTTRVPEVYFHWGLKPALEALPAGSARIALDNVEPEAALSRLGPVAPPCVLAIGSERGWSDGERARLRSSGFTVAGLGARILRTETACISAVTLVLAAMGYM